VVTICQLISLIKFIDLVIFDSDDFRILWSDRNLLLFARTHAQESLWQAQAKPLAYSLITDNKRKSADIFDKQQTYQW
jgi:hypothetical protein